MTATAAETPQEARRHQAEVILNRRRSRAYSRALGRLREKHSDEFAVLLAEEKARVRREPIILNGGGGVAA